MQRLVKNAALGMDRTLFFDVYDLTGVGADGTALTLRITGSEAGNANASGTVSRVDSGAGHKIVISQAQSNTFTVGEEGILKVPGSGSVQELSFPFLCVEDNPGTASPTSAAIATAVWANATRTLTSFGTLVADTATAVWAAVTRTLTAGTNIVLAKGTGVTGLNDLDAAATRAAVGLAAANLDTQLDALPTNSELGVALTGMSTLTPAGVRTAVGLASANLDTQLDALPTNTEFTNALTALVTSVRNAILSWEMFSGYSLARMFRIKGTLDRGTTSGRQGSTETIVDPTATVTVTVNYDADNNRTSMSDNASNTP